MPCGRARGFGHVVELRARLAAVGALGMRDYEQRPPRVEDDRDGHAAEKRRLDPPEPASA